MRRHAKAPTVGSIARGRRATARRLLGTVAFAVLALSLQATLATAASTTATGRAYELVSPAEKNGFPVHWIPLYGDVRALNTGMTAAARDGEAAVFSAWGVFAGSENSMSQTYRSRRTASGWVTAPASSAMNAHQAEVVTQANPTWWTANYNLTQGLIESSNTWSSFDGNKFSSEYGPIDAYLRNEADQDVLISTAEDGQALGGLDPLHALGLPGEGGGHVLFSSRSHVVPEDESRVEGTNNVYENDGGVTRLVSAAPGGGPADPACGSYLPVTGYNEGKIYNAVRNVSAPQSADGTRVVFHTSGERSSEDFFCWFLTPTQVYLREGNRTIHVSESQRSEPDPDGTQEAFLAGASEDLSRIFIASPEMLSDDADPAGSEYIYEFDLDTEELSVVVEGTKTVEAVSSDGSSVFFQLGGTLYRVREGVTTPIATAPDGNLNRGFSGAATDPMSSISSDDGRSLLFVVLDNVTGYDSQETEQAYLWREGEPLRCLSCGQPGSAPGHAQISTGDESTRMFAEPRRYADSLSADGQLVAFATSTKLLPNDINGRRDVYEYDVATERTSLVSDGKSDEDAYLLGMSRGGRDVFFSTAAGLVPQDTDRTPDLYDARTGGGFPSTATEPARSCSGEACQPPAALPPASGTPATTQVDGPGGANQRRAANCRKQSKSTKGKKAQRAKARCAKRTNKNQGKKKGKGSDRRANVPAGKGKGEGK